MRYGSVCSGIEAASVAWEPLGWQPAWFSEIEPFPSAVLAHHWPAVPNLGDMLALPAAVASGEVEAPDVLVGGTPCQAFSLAGRRGSLADERGALTLSYIELANRIDEVREHDGREPSIFVWENVRGVLTTKDNAFGCLLAGLAGEDEPLVPAGTRWSDAGAVFGPRRVVAWRLLDAQYVGVPQRRRRVFVVASARHDLDPLEVLLERAGLRGDPAAAGDQGPREADDHADASVHGVWWDGSHVSQTLDAVLHKKQCLPEKNRFPAVLVPAWVECEPGGDYWCAYHQQHVRECPCPGIEEWTEAELLPYAPSLLRYITPEEGEALQGFPKGHTDVEYRHRKAPDTRRYEAIGNSMPVPVMRWIGHRIDNQLVPLDLGAFSLEFEPLEPDLLGL